jgi:site-specific DNA-methyltransferase (adenine-specific)
MDTNTINLFRSKGSDDWGTPKDLYTKLDIQYHFTLDPCPLKSSFDGLQIPWTGNVFINPPYSNVKAFFKKGREELNNGNATVLVYLVFANTDTQWFHDYVYDVEQQSFRPGVKPLFIKGRLKFTKDGHDNVAMRPSMLIEMRKV